MVQGLQGFGSVRVPGLRVEGLPNVKAFPCWSKPSRHVVTGIPATRRRENDSRGLLK